jgi:type I restriction enzyme, S subunit
MAAVEAMSGHMDTTRTRPWSAVKKGFTRFQEGDVVLAKITPSMENGKVALAINLENGIGAGTTELHVLRPQAGVCGRYLLYYLLRVDFRRRARARMTGTAGQLRVPNAFLEEESLPVAPASEQERIVGSIETYFPRLDAAVISLERAQARLKAYRASVLKAAVEGRLVPTEAELTRAEKRDYEPADVLLKRILVERRRQWQEGELAKLTAAGKTPKDDKWKAKYREPTPPDTTGLPQLPEGWCWASVCQMALVTGGLTKNSAREDSGERLPYLRVANVYANLLKLEDVKTIEVVPSELPRLLLEKGDLLVVEGNGSVDQIGRVALWDGSISPIVHQNHIIKARFTVHPTERWILTWLLSPSGRTSIERVASSTSGLHTLSISKVEGLVVPLAPEAEQERVLEKIDEITSVIDEDSSAIDQAQGRSARLRQSILKWAFEGKLVDQDPNDEPAEKLLERIRAERAIAGVAIRKRTRSAGSSPSQKSS